MSVKMICGNLLDSNTKYIAHQCNCITTRGAHLSADMFKKFPYADIYCTRTRQINWRDSRDKPGTIIVKGNGSNKRYVINMLGQIFPGHPKFPDSTADGYIARQGFFRKCLIAILQEIKDIDSIAFPYGIGCGAAGGDWNKYFEMIEGFSKYVDGEVIIYRLK